MTRRAAEPVMTQGNLEPRSLAFAGHARRISRRLTPGMSMEHETHIA